MWLTIFILFHFTYTHKYLPDIVGLSEAKEGTVLHTKGVVYVWVEGQSLYQDRMVSFFEESEAQSQRLQ